MKIFLLFAASLPSALAIVRNMVTAYPDYYVLLSNTATGDDSFRCSGVLIYPDLVLTSAQCAAGNVTHARVGYKDDDTTTVSVTGVLSHANSPRWSPNHNNKVADIAIITLDTAIEGVTFPTLQSPIMNGLNQLGKEYVVYGAGDFRQGGATAAFLHGDKVATTSLRECATTYRESDRRVVLDQVRNRTRKLAFFVISILRRRSHAPVRIYQNCFHPKGLPILRWN
mmetsp:Transcript_26070/g.43488  ORF Transcript_26070/g.43488 Transcript_26070/m.43488 type:complete len:226 (-) Transcript_26070:138-815(-)